MNKEEAFKAFQFYLQSLRDWELKTYGDLDKELSKMMGSENLTTEQRAIIGIAKVVVERMPPDSKIGSLALKVP